MLRHKRNIHAIDERKAILPRGSFKETFYECYLCEIVFGQKSDLDRHTKTKHSDTEHKCNVCGMNFNRKDNLNRHERIHKT